MKKILLSVFAAGAFVATGQIAVRGVAPASVVQNFNFSHAETDSPAQWLSIRFYCSRNLC